MVSEPDTGFRLLWQWIYDCSENKANITKADLSSKFTEVAEFVNSQAHYQKKLAYKHRSIEG